MLTSRVVGRKWGIDEDEGEDLSGLSQPDLRTLAHQRTVGSSKRFTDELSYLFEGLSSREDLSSRRSSAVQLVGNLLEDEFARKLKAHGLLEKVYEKLRAAGGGGSEGDRVLDTALVFYVATLSVDQRMAEPVLRIPPRRDDAVEDKTGGSEDPLSVDSDCLRVMARILRSPTTKVMVGAAVKGNKSEKLKVRRASTLTPAQLTPQSVSARRTREDYPSLVSETASWRNGRRRPRHESGT